MAGRYYPGVDTERVNRKVKTLRGLKAWAKSGLTTPTTNQTLDKGSQQMKTRAPGAGVKPDDGVSPLDRKQIRLDPESEAILSKVGGGNLSLGIREAARRLVEQNDTTPFTVKRHKERVK